MRIPSSAEFSMFSSGLLDCIRMYDYVKQYGVDRSFVALCNYDLRLDRNLNITLPALTECSEYGNPYDAVSQACMEGLGALIKKGINKLIALWKSFCAMVAGWKHSVINALKKTRIVKTIHWRAGKGGTLVDPMWYRSLLDVITSIEWTDIHSTISMTKQQLSRRADMTPVEYMQGVNASFDELISDTLLKVNDMLQKLKTKSGTMPTKSSEDIPTTEIALWEQRYLDVSSEAAKVLNDLNNSLVISIEHLDNFVYTVYADISRWNDESNFFNQDDLKTLTIFTENCGKLHQAVDTVIRILISITQDCEEYATHLARFH